MRRPVFIVGILGIVGFLVWPLPRWLENPVAGEPLRILDRNGEILYEVRDGLPGLREPVAMDRVPESFVKGLLAAEDRTFYSHPGISLRGIVRSLWLNLRAGHVVAGGSTLTQQLVRASRGPSTRSFV